VAGRQQVMRGRGSVRGIARGVGVRQSGTSSILSFRVERYDGMGNRLPPVGAELIGLVTGELSDGEEVEVFGRWSHGTLKATKITNLSTGAQVGGVSGPVKLTVRASFAVGFTIVLVGAIVFIIFFIHAVKAVGVAP
jgi:hypothetical protein